MSNIRPISEKKYGISKHKFWQVYHYCMQYNEWKDELKFKTNTMKSIGVTDMPMGKSSGDATQALAMRREELSRKCEIIEMAAVEADKELAQYIIKAVTNEGVTYSYLDQFMGIPCGKKMYYDRRRKFYWILSKKI